MEKEIKFYKEENNTSYLIVLDNICIMYVVYADDNQYARFSKSNEYFDTVLSIHPVEITQEEYEAIVPKEWSGTDWYEGLLHGIIKKTLKELNTVES